MTTISMRLEGRLEGSLNFSTWKERVMNILEEHDLDQYVTNQVEIATSNAGQSAFKRNQAKSKRIIFYSVKDGIIIFLIALRTPK